jgi:hypothetical protein
MSQTQNIPWKRISVEALAIVTSILLAFAIDAWWQERNEDDRERQILIALLDDFENSKSSIEEGRNFHIAVQRSNKRLLELAISDDVALSSIEINRLISDLTWWDSQPRFFTGALNSLIYGGELSVIKDDGLRQELADWPSEIQRTESLRSQDYDFFLNVILPYLRQNGSLLSISTIATAKPGSSDEESTLIDLDFDGNSDHSAMISTPEFQNILTQKYWIQDDMLLAFERAESLLAETISHIESKL